MIIGYQEGWNWVEWSMYRGGILHRLFPRMILLQKEISNAPSHLSIGEKQKRPMPILLASYTPFIYSVSKMEFNFSS